MFWTSTFRATQQQLSNYRLTQTDPLCLLMEKTEMFIYPINVSYDRQLKIKELTVRALRPVKGCRLWKFTNCIELTLNQMNTKLVIKGKTAFPICADKGELDITALQEQLIHLKREAESIELQLKKCA
jgi:hypothetical protein